MRIEAMAVAMPTLQTDENGRTYFADVPGEGWEVVAVTGTYKDHLNVVMARSVRDKVPAYPEFNPNRGEYD